MQYRYLCAKFPENIGKGRLPQMQAFTTFSIRQGIPTPNRTNATAHTPEDFRNYWDTEPYVWLKSGKLN